MASSDKENAEREEIKRKVDEKRKVEEKKKMEEMKRIEEEEEKELYTFYPHEIQVL